MCVREREREKKTKRERKLFCQDLRVSYHYPARLLGSRLSSSSLPFSLVSSALPSSRLMEQSMQIARVNRAKDRRRGEEGDNTGVRRLSSAPPIGRHVNTAAAAMSGWIYSKYNLRPAKKKTFGSSSWLSLQVCASFGVTGFRVNYRFKEMKSKNIPYSHNNTAKYLCTAHYFCWVVVKHIKIARGIKGVEFDPQRLNQPQLCDSC